MKSVLSGHNVQLALEAIVQNKMRALLTSLGILFGVASVIAMLAIGEGAQRDILKQLQLLGANNIIISTVDVQTEGDVNDGLAPASKPKFSPGLTIEDAKSIQNLEYVDWVSPETVYRTTFVRDGYQRSGNLVGVNNHFFETSSFTLQQGSLFSNVQLETGAPVCIIGKSVESRFFTKEGAIGKKIKCGRVWLTVVGVLEERSIAQEHIQRLGIRDYNMDVYTPLSCLLMRFRNRALVTERNLSQERGGMNVVVLDDGQSDEDREEKQNYHQLDRLVVRVADTEYMSQLAGIVNRMLQRRHNGVTDVEVVIPEELLANEKETRRIFGFVLLAIASISLIVGGIGIMNIMLASVIERTREIGVRLSLGATKKDVVGQFVAEAVAISLAGGAVGVALGVSISVLVKELFEITTVVTPFSVALSLSVSVATGLAFGIMPAKKAAMKDPVECLRYE